MDISVLISLVTALAELHPLAGIAAGILGLVGYFFLRYRRQKKKLEQNKDKAAEEQAKTPKDIEAIDKVKDRMKEFLKKKNK